MRPETGATTTFTLTLFFGFKLLSLASPYWEFFRVSLALGSVLFLTHHTYRHGGVVFTCTLLRLTPFYPTSKDDLLVHGELNHHSEWPHWDGTKLSPLKA